MPSDGFEGVEASAQTGIEFDAIAAANDFMALGAIAALRKNRTQRTPRRPGYRLDDLPLSRMGNPALTSGPSRSHSWPKRRYRSCSSQMGGRSLPTRTKLVTEFVVRPVVWRRQGALRSKASTSAGASACPREHVQTHGADIARSLAPILERAGMDRERAAQALVAALTAELGGQSPSFVRALEGCSNQAARAIHSSGRCRTR